MFKKVAKPGNFIFISCFLLSRLWLVIRNKKEKSSQGQTIILAAMIARDYTAIDTTNLHKNTLFTPLVPGTCFNRGLCPHSPFVPSLSLKAWTSQESELDRHNGPLCFPAEGPCKYQGTSFNNNFTHFETYYISMLYFTQTIILVNGVN